VNKTFRYFLLCVLVSILPVSCDVQKRRYQPGYFIQMRSSLPGRPYLPGKYIARNLAKNLPKDNTDDSSLTAFDSQSQSWLKNALPVSIENKQLHTNGILAESRHNQVTVPLEKATNTINKGKCGGGHTPTPGKEKAVSSPGPVKNKEYENLMLALLAGAGSGLLLLGIRSGIKKYRAYNFAKKTKEEIANMADRLDRCADRFANAKNDRVELAARKAAIAIHKCDDLSRAKELEKAFNDHYLSSLQASAVQHLKLNKFLSADAGYGTLKPDVVTTTGGFYKNSAGSLSWTMGEPVSETVSNSGNTLTQGFQQGSYSVATVVDELAQPATNISVGPNPVTSLLNVRSDSSDPIRAKTIDMQGKIVYEQLFENGQGQIDLSNLSDEIYILEVYDKEGNRIKVFKIQKVD